MITSKFQIFDPLKDDINTVPALSGNYILCLRKNSKLPDVGIHVTYKKFRDYEVIYVGSASGNLKKRDIKTHFNGNAGESTLRKSLGCLFGYDLMPRDSHYDKNRKTKFNVTDEKKLSDWMKTNLLLFYYPNKEFDRNESTLIKELNPPLNLAKNHDCIDYEFRKHLSELRNNKTKEYKNSSLEISTQRNSDKELYVEIWKHYLPAILSAIKCKQETMKIGCSLFESVGNRKKSGYSFRLDIVNCIIPQKGGSAVARDLKKVLDESSDFKKLANKKNITIRLNANFELIVQVI